jgi:hypothetical protein
VVGSPALSESPQLWRLLGVFDHCHKPYGDVGKRKCLLALSAAGPRPQILDAFLGENPSVPLPFRVPRTWVLRPRGTSADPPPLHLGHSYPASTSSGIMATPPLAATESLSILGRNRLSSAPRQPRGCAHHDDFQPPGSQPTRFRPRWDNILQARQWCQVWTRPEALAASVLSCVTCGVVWTAVERDMDPSQKPPTNVKRSFDTR